MLKLLILLFYLLGVTVDANAGYKYNQPRHTRSGSVNRIHHSSSSAANLHTATSPPTIYEKSFYYFSAPEEKHEPNKQLVKNVVPTSHQNNLQVIFIETPHQQSYKNAIHNVATNAAQQQTHIYLLNKQRDVNAVAAKYQAVQAAIREQQQPEVHFIKYRTEAQAKRAQQQIRAQYGAPGTDSASHGSAKPRSVLPSPINGAANIQSDAPPSLAVDKNYARNFLPTGIDVVPGSSYIPLALRS